MNKQINKNGFSAIITIVVLSAAAFLMAYGAVILGWGELEMGYGLGKSKEALAVAEGCMEESLRRLRTDDSYTGGTLNLGDGSCIISITGTGSERTISVVGTVGNYHKKIESGITISGGEITITSWEELSS